MSELLKSLIADFHSRELPQDIITRELTLPHVPGKIMSIIGPRRAGKTTYLYSLIQDSRNKGKPTSEQVYVNFEDERFSFSTESLQGIIDAYQQMYPDNKIEDVEFYFDEIQEVPAWEKFLRRMLDSVSQKIYITGSSAKLLSREIATQLRGRTLSSTLLPFSFRERLEFFEINPEEVHSTKNRNRIIAHFDDYLERGGYPETFNTDEDTFVRIMQEYGDVLIYRDVVERHRLSKPHVVREFMLRLFSNNSKQISINKIYNSFKSLGLKTSKDTMYSLLEHFTDAFAVFAIKGYDRSPARRAQGQSKIYVNDPGYATAYQPSFSSDLGQKLETVVFLDLARKYRDIFYFSNTRGECDFVVTDRGSVHKLIQVCYELNENNRKRELQGMVSAMEECELGHGYLLTREQEEKIETDSGVITVQPTWKWLLS